MKNNPIARAVTAVHLVFHLVRGGAVTTVHLGRHLQSLGAALLRGVPIRGCRRCSEWDMGWCGGCCNTRLSSRTDLLSVDEELAQDAAEEEQWLDALCCTFTAHRRFADLLAAPNAPLLFPPPFSTRQAIAALQELADAYDAAQGAAGSSLRALRGEDAAWAPGRPAPHRPEASGYRGPLDGVEIYVLPGGYRVEAAGGERVLFTITDEEIDAFLRAQPHQGRAGALRTLVHRLRPDTLDLRAAWKDDAEAEDDFAAFVNDATGGIATAADLGMATTIMRLGSGETHKGDSESRCTFFRLLGGHFGAGEMVVVTGANQRRRLVWETEDGFFDLAAACGVACPRS